MQSIFEQMGGTYRRAGDYFVPDITLPEMETCKIGKYGRMRRRYLEEHRPSLFNTLLLNGTLWAHLAEIDRTCNERMEIMAAAMAEREGVTETLKAADQMEWVRRMNNIRSRTEEIIFSELVCAGTKGTKKN